MNASRNIAFGTFQLYPITIVHCGPDDLDLACGGLAVDGIAAGRPLVFAALDGDLVPIDDIEGILRGVWADLHIAEQNVGWVIGRVSRHPDGVKPEEMTARNSAMLHIATEKQTINAISDAAYASAIS